MKPRDRRSIFSIALVFTLLLISCKKEIQINQQEVAPSTTSTQASACRPVVFGAVVGYPGVSNQWFTLMQKWYGGNGRPDFLKAHFYTEMDGFSMLEHSIEWGQISYYNNNQVYLKVGSDTTLRVTLDAQQRPEASYYHHNHFPKGTYLVDTSYYHFTGSRLDAVERLYVGSYGGRSNFAKYNFIYDSHGSLVRVDSWSPTGSASMFLSYDYSKPVADMVAIPQITIPFKLMEYLELLNFGVRYELIRVVGFGNDWQLMNYTLTGSGLVSSYQAEGLHERTFYTGWDCSSVSSLSNSTKGIESINDLNDFRRAFGATRD